MDQANAALSELVNEGTITAEEQAQMVLGCYPRRRSEILAPFRDGEPFEGLALQHCEEFEMADPAWVQFESDRDRESLAGRQAGFFRAVFTPSLASTLLRTRSGHSDAPARFAERLEERLTRRLAATPTDSSVLVQIVVLSKA